MVNKAKWELREKMMNERQKRAQAIDGAIFEANKATGVIRRELKGTSGAIIAFDESSSFAKGDLAKIDDLLDAVADSYQNIVVFSGGRRSGKSAIMDNIHEHLMKMNMSANFLPSEEDMEEARRSNEQRELEAILLEAEREACQYGGW